ncbi:protein SFI1 homolog isoform X1 [Tachyglossus aculeatus]|uniref:protein SFI1 homolog isoform X1 n=1 Tax=Tachyglossus aculeatus TaxID=9261 RepID=UPI0018F2BC84|nr:protein SFI1 homolog isoform X1 [Tachyglossus aculeatus]
MMEKKPEARSLRRDVVCNPHSLKGTTCKMPSVSRRGHPIPHQVTNTRSRGGRLKELHIRCLARKFFYLWVKKTFGRILPSKARSHYERKVLQKTFGEWKEEWWIFQREWKLCVRADCHYRYFLYNLMFQSWKTYIHQRRAKRSKCRRAESHAAKQRTHRAWQHWLIYVEVRRTKAQMQAASLAFRKQSTLRVAWSAWTQQLQQIRIRYELDVSALHHWALSLQFRAFLQWRQLFLHMQANRQKEVQAVRHHQHGERRKFMKTWLVYLHHRRQKRRQGQLALQFYHISLAQRCFSGWQGAWEQRKNFHAYQECIKELAARTTLRRVFTHWKHYTALCAEEAAQYSLAEQHHRHHLLSCGFGALKENVKNSHLHKMNENLAHRQHHVMLLQRFWNRWQYRVEQKEEEKQRPLTSVAQSHFRKMLLQKYFEGWFQNAQRRRSKQLQYAKAEAHFRRKVLPSSFQAWRRFRQRQQQQREMKETALHFHREVVERQVFDTWWQRMHQQQENQLAERMAILHSEQLLLHRFWSVWLTRVAVRTKEREGEVVADNHYRHRQLLKAFQLWKENVQELRTERTGLRMASQFYSQQVLWYSWSKWRQYVARRSAKWQKLVCADLHYRRALLSRVLRAWMTYQHRVQLVLEHVAEKEKQHKRQLLRRVFHTWKKHSTECVIEAEKTAEAVEHLRRRVVSKVLVHWRDAAALQVYCRQQEAAVVMDARKKLDRGLLRSVFLYWREFSQRTSLQRAQLDCAARHHGKRLLQECMSRWKQHHLHCIRKMLLQRQGVQLMARRLSRSCFSQWKHQLAEKQREHQATVQALWFWSFSLKGKVFDAWGGFVLEQRRKRSRLEQAMQAYQADLLQEGVTRLLRFTAGVKSFRRQLRAHQQAQVADRLHRTVQRCAVLWKQKALGKGRPRFPGPRKTVTSDGLLLGEAGGSPEASLESERARPSCFSRKAQALPALARLESPFSDPPEKPAGPSQKTASNVSPEETGNSSASPQTRPSGSRDLPRAQAGNCLLDPSSGPGPLPNAAGRVWSSGDHSAKSPGPELLLPPSSFLPRAKGELEMGTTRSLLAHLGLSPPEGPRISPEQERNQPVCHLLLPQDFTRRKRNPQPVSEGKVDAKRWESCTTEGELEAELQEIQQNLQCYHANKQNLK